MSIVKRKFFAVLFSFAAATGTVFVAEPALAFNGPGAAAWADANYNATSIPNYKFYGSDCTNFVSASWNRGSNLPMSNNWHQARWYNTDGYYFAEGSSAFITVKGFRSYWYANSKRYILVQGRAALNSKMSAAVPGDAYIFDSGNSRIASDWEHATIEVRYNVNGDIYAQHSAGKEAPWTRWWATRNATQRWNILRSGRGFRIITPDA